MKKTIALLLCLLLFLLPGCSTEEQTTVSESTEAQSSTAVSQTEIENATADEVPAATDLETVEFDRDTLEESDYFTDRDRDPSYNVEEAVLIELRGDTAVASSDSVKISDSMVILTQEETYIISGTLDNGMIVVDAPDTAKLQLVLNQVNITSNTSAPLYILEADKVFVTLAGENTLSNGGTFEAVDDSNIDAAVFSKQDVTFNGSGSMTISSPAGHGIVGKDDLVFTGGTYDVTSSGHAVEANDSVRIMEASITASAGKDGFHVENTEDTEKGYVYMESGTLNIEAEGDGIDASGYVDVQGGTVDILAGGGYENGEKASSGNWGGFGGRPGGGPGGFPGWNTTTTETEDESTSMKGVKSGGDLTISDGIFNIDSADDAIHSNASATISGGTFEVATGDDGFHAEDTLSVTDGTINISTSYEGLEALHVLVSGGDIALVATDDGLNAAGGVDESGTTGGRDGMFPGGPWGGPMGGNSNGTIVISGGKLYVNSSGDGMDANGTLEITDGEITVVGPTQGDTATLDYDRSSIISGGSFVGTGSSFMAQTLTGSEQGVITVRAGQQAEGTEITVTDGAGNVLLSYAPELPFQTFIFSSPEVVSGETYTVSFGETTSEYTAY